MSKEYDIAPVKYESKIPKKVEGKVSLSTNLIPEPTVDIKPHWNKSICESIEVPYNGWERTTKEVADKVRWAYKEMLK